MRSFWILALLFEAILVLPSCRPYPPHINYARRVGDKLEIGVQLGGYEDERGEIQSVVLYAGAFDVAPYNGKERIAKVVRLAGARELESVAIHSGTNTELDLGKLQLSPEGRYYLLSLDGDGASTWALLDITDVIFHKKTHREFDGEAVTTLWCLLMILMTVGLVVLLNYFAVKQERSKAEQT